MSEPVTAAGWSQPAPPPPHALPGGPETAEARSERVFAAVLAAGLVVLGALLGLVWAAWSPAGPRALVLSPGVFVPDETEAFIAGDGRFLVIATAVGLLAGLLAWRRTATRGPIVLLALAAGGLLGSTLMALVGHLTGGGTFAGRADTLIDQLPLSLHMHGLLFVEPAAAGLVYGLCVAFTVHDDLGRPDPARERVRLSREPALSVGAGAHPQDGGGYGDAAGLPEQRDLPPQ